MQQLDPPAAAVRSETPIVPPGVSLQPQLSTTQAQSTPDLQSLAVKGPAGGGISSVASVPSLTVAAGDKKLSVSPTISN